MMASRLINQDLMFVQCKHVMQAVDRLIILVISIFIINQKANAQECPTILLESSFEINSCCPDDRNYSTLIDCLDEGWLSPTGSADYLHTCGFLGDDFSPTVPLPMPSGNGAVGIATFSNPFPFYESMVNCLDNAMSSGETHEISFYMGFGTPAQILYTSPLNTTLGLYGKTTCTGLWQGGDDCLSNEGWELITEIPVSATSEGTWVFVSHNFVPSVNYTAIGLAMVCGSYQNQYHFLDDVKIIVPAQNETLDLIASGDCIQGVTIEVVDGDIDSDYQWFLNDVVIPGATSNSLIVTNALADGEYKVEVTIELGCSVFDSIVIDIDENVLIVNGLVEDINCSLEDIGSINISTNSNNQPLIFDWNSGNTSGFIDGLPDGEYQVTVTDANGCMGTNSFTVISTPPLEITTSFTEITCTNPTSDIEINIVIGSPTFDFLWSDGSTSESLTNVAPGQYAVTVVDANGCTDQLIIEIPENNIINLMPIFDTLICASIEAFVLPQLSSNGLVGFWSPPVISPEDMINNEFVSVWNPIDPLSTCATDLAVTFLIQLPLSLSFDLTDSLCLNTGLYNLPTTSLEGISGQWNISNINTDTQPAGTINLTFSTPEFCVEDFNDSLEIQEQKIPLFNIKTDLCKSEPAFVLPATSLEGITGSWSQPIIDPSIINSGFITTFTPDSAYQFCYLPVNVVFQISSTIIPIFDFPLVVCASDAPIIFPTISTNGIIGSWTSMIIDLASIDSSYIKNTFKPLNPICEESVDVTINIIKLNKPSIITNHPTDCNKADGSIIPLGSVTDNEFSMDGISWQSNTTFDNLTNGRFIIYQRSILNKSCVDSLVVDLVAPSVPKILTLDVSDNTSCKVINGKVICNAHGENLEYSIYRG